LKVKSVLVESGRFTLYPLSDVRWPIDDRRNYSEDQAA
jgi:hypothetical protein